MSLVNIFSNKTFHFNQDRKFSNEDTASCYLVVHRLIRLEPTHKPTFTSAHSESICSYAHSHTLSRGISLSGSKQGRGAQVVFYPRRL